MTAKEIKTVGGKGKKQCPHCEQYVAARSTTCEFCKKAIPPKTPAKPKSSKNSGLNWNEVFATLENVNVGELEAAIETVQGALEAQAVLDKVGGVEGAQKLLELTSKFGTPGTKPAKKKVV
jgi:hypothetical protein